MKMKRIVKYLPIFVLIILPIVLEQTAVTANPDVTVEIDNFTWTSEEILSTQDPNSLVAERPVIEVADNDTIIVAFLQQNPNNSTDYDPFFVTSTNNGQTWTDPSRIKNTGTRSRQVDIAFDETNRAHAVWTEDGNVLAYAPSGQWNGDSSFNTIDMNSTSVVVIENPKIIATGSNSLDVVWAASTVEDPSLNIYYSHRDFGVGSWSTPKIVSNGGVSTFPDSRTPDIAITSNGNINIVWEEQVSGTQNAVYYGRSTNGGSSWSAAVDLSEVAGISNSNTIQPRIIADGNTVHVVFGERKNADTQFVHYTYCNTNCANKTSWKTDINPISGQKLGTNTTDPFDIFPTVAESKGCILSYFHGIVTGSNELIYGASSCNNWGNQREQVTGVGNRAIKPDIAVENDWFVYLVYEEAELNQVRFLRTQPAIYLPVIMRQYVAGP